MSRRRSGTSIRVSRAAWCLERGPDTCDFCLQAFHIEAAYYCAGCDRPFCPLCAGSTEAGDALRCPECADPGDD